MNTIRIARWTVGMALGLLVTGGCGVGDEYYFFHREPGSPPEDAGPSPPMDHAPQITLVLVAPLRTDIGAPIGLSATASDFDRDTLHYAWTARTGSIKNAKSEDATYTCKKHGNDTVELSVSDGRLSAVQDVVVGCY